MTKLIKIITKISVFSFIGLIFNIILIYKFLSLWISPQVGDVEMIFNLIVLLIFEFFMIHTRLFMSIVGRSLMDWLYGTVFFGAFVLMFNSLVKGNLILIIYAAMIVNRMLPRILNSEKADRKQELNIAMSNFMIYFGLVFIVAICSYFIPLFGLTEDFLEAANYKAEVDWKFELIDMPHLSMCFGILYYLTLTVVEIIPITDKQINNIIH